MKNYFTIFAGLTITALIISSCSPVAYAQPDNGYYDTAYGYNYNYGDGQPDDYYDQSNVDYNNQDYPYSQPGNVPVNQPPAGFNDFYTQLSPYGVWVNIPPYGQVWVANVRNFQPYSTNGYWAYTTYGWTWVSYYPWGWAPFHYGRWGYNNRYGWYWVPGYVWGPAWVVWSSSADMFGWAPLMPGMRFGVNLSINLFPSSYWTFMPGRYMGRTNLGGYYVNRSRNVTIINNTTIINNYGTENNRRYSTGPSANDVQRYTGRSIQPMRVSNVSNSRSEGVSSDELRVYRPVTRDATSNRSTTPGNNNRTGTPQTRSSSDQPASRTATPQSRTQPDQPATRTGTPQSRTQYEQPSTRTTTPQSRTQNDQPATRTETPQSRTQYEQQPATRTTTSQTRRSQSSQPATQQTTSPRVSRQAPTQPTVSNRAAPQTSKQIQNAERDSKRTQQRSSTSSSTRR